MIIIVPGMVPPSPNELRRKYRHPQAYAKLRDTWHEAIFYLVPLSDRKQLRELAEHTGRMQVELTIWNPREYDPDNLQACQKPVLDALKGLGFIRDDARQWLRLEPAKYQHCSRLLRRTIICIDAESS